MMKNIFGRTAKDFLATHPDVAEQMRQVAQDDAAIEARGRQLERPLLEDLARVGVTVESVFDLLPMPASSYERALPTLCKHLSEDYDEGTMEGIVRALAVPSAAFAFPTLYELYLNERGKREDRSERVSQALAVALAETVTVEHEAQFLDLFNLQTDDLRTLLLDGLTRLGTPQAVGLLDRLSRDPQLGREARSLLRRRRKND